MRKRARFAEPIKEEFNEEDYISALPDHILVSILSRLTLKEAAATSILSRQWRYIWTRVAELNFDGFDIFVDDHKLRSSYINWVNRVLRQYRGPVVDGVRICCELDKSSKRAVDNWVKFAIVKRVQRLELDLSVNGEFFYLPPRNYTFPYKLLSRSKGMSLNNVYSNYGLTQPSMLSCLEVLSLKAVNVSEEALDCFFSNCPVLNHLSIYSSGVFKNVKVSGLTLRLKYLEIVFCTEIETIEISNVNLVSFAYLGHKINLITSNVPMLDDFSIGEWYCGLRKNVFEQLPSCVHQLQVLTLVILYPEENIKDYHFPVLPNLKKLILKMGARNDQSLLEFASLIKACPNLNRFVLQLFWITPSYIRREVRQGAKCKHEHLKSVEISGYFGRTSDAEVAMYFIENAVALETIVIDPRNQKRQRYVRLAQIKNEVFARRRARKQLESKIPPGVQLIIL